MPAIPAPPSSPAARARIRTAFRVLAVVEALTWAGLLASMGWHYLLDGSRHGIEVFGALHGGAFLLYGAVALLTWGVQRWRWWVGLLALGAALPPFGTVVFEVLAQRRGLLDDRPGAAAGGGRTHAVRGA
ncbi:DUF3817 domain-containing protein [uncultured Pseudokineococcus sp.]|uniref:DUF3817 domain-containing protein n=1 Tax=uncultured Pseudokineococcus sp. TaxID=1642928 RepID=UPI00262D4A99|nr:DUF3817 domain-containing protein [uncultured Pseudokineococcus sp.]